MFGKDKDNDICCVFIGCCTIGPLNLDVVLREMIEWLELFLGYLCLPLFYIKAFYYLSYNSNKCIQDGGSPSFV